MPHGSQSLSRAFQLIEVLSGFPNGCPLARLSELVELNKSTTHRILQALSAMGYVTHAGAAGSYRLTAKLVAVGQKALSSLNIIQVAAPFLETLNLETGETVNLSHWEADHTVLIYKLEPTRSVMRTHAYIGQQSALHCTAMGKLYLAHAAEGYVERYWANARIERLTEHTIVALDALHAELAQIRATGIAFDREENELGVSCIAAPVFDVKQRVEYAISTSLPTSRLAAQGQEALIGPIRLAARQISAELGG
ncbi:DNA-binding IclR family transcriptional regulator [Silvimonas terrae]|uniref:DNA-binding IclR family transcriptional regulator n=1 Tax=Silvimonas terrae TaxID=300266 RepID=A0A840RJR9_9NEIS|nr:IclR family transcriptional regulator [Silvimonas terrae]MBB5193555.1 DNA-binding IclR family transcriptional regulator [Silvimonas terrae]